MERIFTVVLTDDDDDEHFFFEEALDKLNRNINLRTFPNGERLLEWIEKTETIPDALFLDINMPLLGGFETLQILRKDKRYDDLPVIIYSTSNTLQDRSKAFSYGANLYLSKVVAIKDLSGNLSRILDAIEQKNLEVIKDFVAF
jgi:CheY-like chemotaxis protein